MFVYVYVGMCVCLGLVSADLVRFYGCGFWLLKDTTSHQAPYSSSPYKFSAPSAMISEPQAWECSVSFEAGLYNSEVFGCSFL